MLSSLSEAQPVSTNVIIVVDLDAAAAPPASDAVRQLLALIESLGSGDQTLDWRLMSVSLNSPLRAELQAFTDDGGEVSEAHAADAVHRGFEVLASVNDNTPDAERKLARLDSATRARLKTLLTTLKGRTGAVAVDLPGRFSLRVTGTEAQDVVDRITRLDRQSPPPAPELGGVEGHITEVLRHYNQPAVRLRRDLTEESVLCVFESEEAAGEDQTITEVWKGQRVEVSGTLYFNIEGRVVKIWNATMRAIREGRNALDLLREARARGEVAESLPWGDDD